MSVPVVVGAFAEDLGVFFVTPSLDPQFMSGVKFFYSRKVNHLIFNDNEIGELSFICPNRSFSWLFEGGFFVRLRQIFFPPPQALPPSLTSESKFGGSASKARRKKFAEGD
jgi:hypothetical protein